MESSDIPIIVSTVFFDEMDGKILIINAESEKVLELNYAASFIWCCCDGSTEVAEIQRQTADYFGKDKNEIRCDVIKTLECFVDKGLITKANPGCSRSS